MKQAIMKFVPKNARTKMREFYNKAAVKKRAQQLKYEGNSAEVLQCQVAYNMFGGYCVPLSSYCRPAAQAILNGQVWEPETIAELRKFAKIGGGDVVHAGTYFGDFYRPFQRHVRLARRFGHLNQIPKITAARL